MRQTTFGRRTGLRVSEYALGTANFGTGRGAGAEPDEARRIFDRSAEAGGPGPAGGLTPQDAAAPGRRHKSPAPGRIPGAGADPALSTGRERRR